MKRWLNMHLRVSQRARRDFRLKRNCCADLRHANAVSSNPIFNSWPTTTGISTYVVLIQVVTMGRFFRISTLSTLMFSGGNKTGIPRATVIDEPYDSLSFVPTVLALTGQLGDDNRPGPQLREKGFRRFPAPPIKEVLSQIRR